MNGYHATSYNNSITLTDNDVIALAEKSGLDKKTAKMIQDEPKNFFSFCLHPPQRSKIALYFSD
jgi:hypothetical protein